MCMTEEIAFLNPYSPRHPPPHSLDAKPGLVPDLVPGIQDSKSSGSLGQTWDQSKSLKFILIDSNFLLSPCPFGLISTRISYRTTQESRWSSGIDGHSLSALPSHLTGVIQSSSSLTIFFQVCSPVLPGTDSPRP